MMDVDGMVEGGVREWWHENSLNSRRRGFGVEDLDSSKHAKARRRGDGSGSAYFENIVLPPRPSELGGSSRGSSSDRSVDNLFDQDMGAGSNLTLASGGSLRMNIADADEPKGHRRKQRLSFLFRWLAAGGLRRKLPTLCFLLILVTGAFLLGRVSSISGGSSSEPPPPPPQPPPPPPPSSLSSPEVVFSASERTGARGSAVNVAQTGNDNQEQAEESSFIPKCGTEYAIPGGSGYGGHNEALGCLNAGKMAWPSCVHLLATNRAKNKHKKVGRRGSKGLHCTAATWKGQECWLHDRRMDDWWSEQNGEIEDYAPDSEDSTGEALLASGPNKGSALLQAAKGKPILIIRLEYGLDNCRL